MNFLKALDNFITQSAIKSATAEQTARAARAAAEQAAANAAAHAAAQGSTSDGSVEDILNAWDSSKTSIPTPAITPASTPTPALTPAPTPAPTPAGVAIPSYSDAEADVALGLGPAPAPAVAPPAGGVVVPSYSDAEADVALGLTPAAQPVAQPAAGQLPGGPTAPATIDAVPAGTLAPDESLVDPQARSRYDEYTADVAARDSIIANQDLIARGGRVTNLFGYKPSLESVLFHPAPELPTEPASPQKLKSNLVGLQARNRRLYGITRQQVYGPPLFDNGKLSSTEQHSIATEGAPNFSQDGGKSALKYSSTEIRTNVPRLEIAKSGPDIITVGGRRQVLSDGALYGLAESIQRQSSRVLKAVQGLRRTRGVVELFPSLKKAISAPGTPIGDDAVIRARDTYKDLLDYVNGGLAALPAELQVAAQALSEYNLTGPFLLDWAVEAMRQEAKPDTISRPYQGLTHTSTNDIGEVVVSKQPGAVMSALRTIAGQYRAAHNAEYEFLSETMSDIVKDKKDISLTDDLLQRGAQTLIPKDPAAYFGVTTFRRKPFTPELTGAPSLPPPTPKDQQSAVSLGERAPGYLVAPVTFRKIEGGTAVSHAWPVNMPPLGDDLAKTTNAAVYAAVANGLRNIIIGANRFRGKGKAPICDLLPEPDVLIKEGIYERRVITVANKPTRKFGSMVTSADGVPYYADVSPSAMGKSVIEYAGAIDLTNTFALNVPTERAMTLLAETVGWRDGMVSASAGEGVEGSDISWSAAEIIGGHNAYVTAFEANPAQVEATVNRLSSANRILKSLNAEDTLTQVMQGAVSAHNLGTVKNLAESVKRVLVNQPTATLTAGEEDQLLPKTIATRILSAATAVTKDAEHYPAIAGLLSKMAVVLQTNGTSLTGVMASRILPQLSQMAKHNQARPPDAVVKLYDKALGPYDADQLANESFVTLAQKLTKALPDSLFAKAMSFVPPQYQHIVLALVAERSIKPRVLREYMSDPSRYMYENYKRHSMYSMRREAFIDQQLQKAAARLYTGDITFIPKLASVPDVVDYIAARQRDITAATGKKTLDPLSTTVDIASSEALKRSGVITGSDPDPYKSSTARARREALIGILRLYEQLGSGTTEVTARDHMVDRAKTAVRGILTNRDALAEFPFRWDLFAGAPRDKQILASTEFHEYVAKIHDKMRREATTGDWGRKITKETNRPDVHMFDFFNTMGYEPPLIDMSTVHGLNDAELKSANRVLREFGNPEMVQALEALKAIKAQGAAVPTELLEQALVSAETRLPEAATAPDALLKFLTPSERSTLEPVSSDKLTRRAALDFLIKTNADANGDAPTISALLNRLAVLDQRAAQDGGALVVEELGIEASPYDQYGETDFPWFTDGAFSDKYSTPEELTTEDISAAVERADTVQAAKRITKRQRGEALPKSTVSGPVATTPQAIEHTLLRSATNPVDLANSPFLRVKFDQASLTSTHTRIRNALVNNPAPAPITVPEALSFMNTPRFSTSVVGSNLMVARGFSGLPVTAPISREGVSLNLDFNSRVDAVQLRDVIGGVEFDPGLSQKRLTTLMRAAAVEASPLEVVRTVVPLLQQDDMQLASVVIADFLLGLTDPAALPRRVMTDIARGLAQPELLDYIVRNYALLGYAGLPGEHNSLRVLSDVVNQLSMLPDNDTVGSVVEYIRKSLAPRLHDFRRSVFNTTQATEYIGKRC